MTAMETRSLSGFHYGWVVVGVTFATLLVTAGAMSTPGLLMVALQREFGWSAADISTSVSLRLAVFGLMAPFSAALPLAVLCYVAMGSGRGIAGIAISSSMMEMVPKHFMGRVQNTFFFIGTLLQLVTSVGVGVIAQQVSLALAFAIIGVMYGVASITAAWPVATPEKVAALRGDAP